MKAAICTRYGPPEVLEIHEVAKPVPKENEMLIRIHGATVGAADCAFRKGDPFIIQIMYGFGKPRFPTTGAEFGGVIEATGRAVTQFKAGDEVYGLSSANFGAHAEYLCLAESGVIAPKPTNLSYGEAAGVVDGAATSLTFLRDTAHLQRGQKVLINGASGAVGSYGVQLAKYYGAEVTGVCSGANVAMVKSLGAEKVIDYTQTDFTQQGERYDVIFDAVGKSSFGRCQGSLTDQGLYLTTVPSWGIIGQMLWTSVAGSKKAKLVTAGLMQNKANLLFLKELCEAGHIRPVVDRTYPLDEIVAANRYVDTGRKKGNVLLVI